jgi:DNA adenine methylase
MNAPFGWPGGKRYLLKTLLKLIPPHKAYVEVFSGSAKLLFAKEPSQWEVLNDVNDDLVNFFRVAKHRPAELAEMFDSDLVSSTRFYQLRARKFVSAERCELEQAHRFSYLIWLSFGCMGETFAAHTLKMKTPVKKSLQRVRELLMQTSQRLSRVLVERRDFADCIARYDSRETFFYLDPPYTNFKDNGAYKPMEERRNAELLKLLKKIKGKFLLSYDDSPLVRELAGAAKFSIKPVKVLYTLGRSENTRKARELLISNYW